MSRDLPGFPGVEPVPGLPPDLARREAGDFGGLSAEDVREMYPNIGDDGIDQDWFARALRDALSVERHQLRRSKQGMVTCSCGQYAGVDRGRDAGVAWRGHLIDVAIEAIWMEISVPYAPFLDPAVAFSLRGLDPLPEGDR